MNTDIWSSAQLNTKTFIIGQITQYDVRDRSYLQGCKHCNDLVDIAYTDKRGQLGNCWQRVVICNGCENTWVIDDHKENDFLRALKYRPIILNL